MSTNLNNEPDQNALFKNPYHTEFMRVSHNDEDNDVVRHPGTPKISHAVARKQSSNSPFSPQNTATTYGGISSSQGRPATDNVMCCPVCNTDYDTVMKRPILLPGCGHTLCSVCVTKRSFISLECPICRRSYPGASIDSLPVNISLETLLVNKYGQTTLQQLMKEQVGGTGTNGNCLAHGVRLSFWCRTCNQVACGECLFDKHPPSDGHELAKLQDVAGEIREKAISTISVCHDDATKLFSENMKQFVALLENLHGAGKLMQDSRKLVAAAECSKDFASVTSVFEAIKKIESQVVKQKHEEKYEDIAAEEAEQKETGDSESETKVGNFSESGQVLAMHSDGRLARVQTEEHGLHIYALAQFPTANYNVAIRLGMLMEFIQGENPTVFLDFNYQDTKLGRIYLRLKGDMRRSSQFLNLCLGTMGPSYKGSRVDGISEKGVPGEYLHMGDYTGQGGQGGVALIDGLEWGNKWSGPKKGGEVCGMGGDAGEKRFGALFAICIRDNPKDQFRCPFGEVIRGMAVMYTIAKMETIDGVYISDCGAIIPVV